VARFSDVWLSELYTKSDIVDVISEYTTLTERGGRYWGLCPFHHEKTPSFSVNQEKQLYYCFGCKQGGNVANFIMKIENLTFGEAAELLARRCGLPMPQMIDDKQYRQIKEKKQQIAAMHKLAARFYHETLMAPEGKTALGYLKKRGIGEDAIKRFGLGYAPDRWESVASLLAQNGYSAALINESGLVTAKNDKVFDTFRNRVMFPIINVFGEVIAFGGRVLDDSTPKYLNTRETALFNKRRNLYGIDLLRRQRSIKSAVIVEGYMDVVSMYAHGVKSVVASLGTALTKEQAILMKRYTNDVFIAYDGDEAGEIATQKAMDILETEGLSVRVIRFDEGLDPDDFIRRYGLAGFAKKVKVAPSAMGYRLEIKKREFLLDTEDGREGYAIEAAKIIARIDSPIRRERYAEAVAEQTGYSTTSILGQMHKKNINENTNANYRYNKTEKTAADGSQSAFLACAMADVRYFADVADDISAEEFPLKSHKNIFSALYDSVKRGIQPTNAELLSQLEDEEDRNEAARLMGIKTAAENPVTFLKDCIIRMRIERREREREALKEALHGASVDEQRKLLAEIGEIDKELNQIRFE
jgi:DNA primase